MSDSSFGQDESLAGQRLRLASLQSCEERIRSLRDQECDLEVEHIAAEAALHSAASRIQSTVEPALALPIGQALERLRELAEERRDANEEHGLGSTRSARELDRLRAGCAALQSWLDASQPEAPSPVARAARIALLIATVATLWAAYAIHPAFLLLLVVVVGPVSFAMGRGQDTQWHRVGARRRFEASGLADIPAWDDESVRARMLELESLLATSKRNRPQTDGDFSRDEPPDKQAEAGPSAEEDLQLASLLDAAGLTIGDTKGDMGKWLRLIARADQSRESLERVKNERLRLRAEAAEYRDHLLRYLQSQGDRPSQQRDTTAAIAERLDRLSESP